MARFLHLMGDRDDDFYLHHRYVTSWLLSPTHLAALRGLIALYIFTTLFFILGWQGTHGLVDRNNGEFSYFTVLTFWGLGFYFAFAAAHTFVYARTGRAPLEHWPAGLRVAHGVLYSSIVTFPFLVTIVFWVVLYEGPWFASRFDAWSNVSRHGLNSLFALLEVALPATNPPPWLHLAFLILILALYVALAYVTRASQGFYVYSFLDPATGGSGRVAAYVFGILAAIIVIFVVVWLIIWVRRRLTGIGSRKSGNNTFQARDTEMGMFGK